MALLVQKREDLSSIPRTYVKMPNIVAYICHHGAEEAEGIPGPAGCWPSLIGELKANGRSCLKEMNSISEDRTQAHCPHVCYTRVYIKKDGRAYYEKHMILSKSFDH